MQRLRQWAAGSKKAASLADQDQAAPTQPGIAAPASSSSAGGQKNVADEEAGEEEVQSAIALRLGISQDAPAGKAKAKAKGAAARAKAGANQGSGKATNAPTKKARSQVLDALEVGNVLKAKIKTLADLSSFKLLEESLKEAPWNHQTITLLWQHLPISFKTMLN